MIPDIKFSTPKHWLYSHIVSYIVTVQKEQVTIDKDNPANASTTNKMRKNYIKCITIQVTENELVLGEVR